jgi:hypothetical protein
MKTKRQAVLERHPLTMQCSRSVWTNRRTGHDAVLLRIEVRPHTDLVHYRFVGETASQCVRARAWLEQFERRLSEVP